ncbi:LacI family transcriptional regulator [Fodinisporobacter ferrooxydans]|uniref:LacI family transcriptional regulator n=1 Tax=Fodinisporobacter ferrooxydans TaxID=2901836 RepID=A0ABY4CDL8_9BACL|nr:LacI family transcriptional regulator [Alicyclobacillaceae bacterium MYW30-H2]
MGITMKDIAREAGVSVATVSHVINKTKHVSAEKQRRILEVIGKLQYSPNIAAKNLKMQKTNTAGLVVSSFLDSYVTSIVNGVGNRARELGYNLLFVNTNEQQQYEEEAVRVLSSNAVDGMILSPTTSNLRYLGNFLEKQLPIVFINRYDPHFPEIPRVTADDFQAGYDAAFHLLGHGHTKIGLVLAVPNVTSTVNRIAGYKAALLEKGISFDESLLEIGYATVDGGLNAVKSLLKREPQITALFTLSDLMTIGAVKALNQLSLRCPEDIAIIGFGDFEAAAAMYPPITNVNPPHTIGQTAFDLLLNKMQNFKYTKHIQLPVSLIIRKSCGC